MAAPSTASGPVRAAGAPDPTRTPGGPRGARVADHGITLHDAITAERWTANGTVKVAGAVDVGSADVAGTVSVAGGLTADAFRARGTLEVDGPVRVQELFLVRGDARCGGGLRSGDLTIDGTVRVEGPVTVDRTLSLDGTLHAPSVSAGVLEAVGAMVVPGEVRGATVIAELRRASALGSVVARHVRLRGHVPNVVDKVFFHLEPVTVGRVEADGVELTGVDVAFVRAKEIVLGRDAHVTALEGTVVRRHPSSSVGPRSRSPPPYGLRR